MVRWKGILGQLLTTGIFLCQVTILKKFTSEEKVLQTRSPLRGIARKLLGQFHKKTRLTVHAKEIILCGHIWSPDAYLFIKQELL